MATATAETSRNAAKAATGPHGAAELPSVVVTSYNLEVRDDDGFVGDKASRGAFMEHLDALRSHLKRNGDDPLEGKTAEISKKELDSLLQGGDAREAALVLSAIEGFAQSLAFVIRRFTRLKSWAEIERIVVGGGFRESRVGELAIARAAIILRTDGRDLDLVPVSHHPDEAGLVGSAHLAPKWIFEAYDSLVAVDIGGSNIRAGIVELRQKKAPDLSKARVWKSELWRHAEEEPSRDEAIKRLGRMLREQIANAEKAGLRVAPFIGIGCPGLIEPDGAIDRGAQNLPGNWESSRFNLVDSIRALVPEIGEHETEVVMHNDAVIQGLSEMPGMQDVESWAVLTIGTGLGNASYRNRAKGGRKRRD
ncbi:MULTISPECIES: ROK family protein [Bosea]|uniref:ROK family protein n=1 Tax=Bosea TaxID=85413 RepID=UPI00214FF27F|nr:MULTISPECIES: ROK family protein [Bosea]MCR4522432.1 ROK family protein [Bosea sp. 47.2.35]MDR6829099.1 putative NBD/HSP70 family sugar kinase [Bosea robiniae]MDR6895983.1 putative NBD/HSP70 family sugar kinase [Bosea sp. BE109]MDR7139380.1 putative NBD/HSP70 family sugar kinase [Bosea sp. BE168]MDR7176078.1 putative NBD/HSP70 family sugar kinase [Bosea sp. BE271]